MSNKNIFCNVPWTNTHIYWDGSYGVCCSERHKPYPDSESANNNIGKMGVVEWYSSDAMNEIRNKIKSDTRLSQCRSCYGEEINGSESRRIKENFKSVIFTELAFDKSYEQSPWYERFESNDVSAPIDWHIDFGNECNLMCKMCLPRASSKIASQYKKWGIYSGPILTSWANDKDSWDRITTDILNVEKLNRIHVMGGEPTINKKFMEFLKLLRDKGKTDTSISFVTNGTNLNLELVDVLKSFRSFDIEISIESLEANNAYIRQGTDTQVVIDNILKLKDMQSEQFKVVLRTAPQLLSVNTYDKLIRWAYDNKLPIQSIPLNTPEYMKISVLPLEIRNKLIPQYEELLRFLESENTEPKGLFTGRIVSGLPIQLARETTAILNALRSPEPMTAVTLRRELIADMKRWDEVCGFDACEIFPEFSDFFKRYGY